MRRPVLYFGAALALAVIITMTVFIVQKRQHDAERARAVAKYRQIAAADSNVEASFHRFQSLVEQCKTLFGDGANASQQRHDLANENPYDRAGMLRLAEREVDDVGQLLSLAEDKANAARETVNALTTHFGEARTSSLLTDISTAAETESKALTDWSRGANVIRDHLTAVVNGRWYSSYGEDVTSLYRTSDEEEGVANARWDTVTSRMQQLRHQLAAEVAFAKQGAEEPGSGHIVSLQSSSSTTVPFPDVRFTSRPDGNARYTAPSPTANADASPEFAQLLQSTRQIRLVETGASDCGGSDGLVIRFKDDNTGGCARAANGFRAALSSGATIALIPVSAPNKGTIYDLMYVYQSSGVEFVGTLPGNGSGHVAVTVENGVIVERNGSWVKRSTYRNGRVVPLSISMGGGT